MAWAGEVSGGRGVGQARCREGEAPAEPKQGPTGPSLPPPLFREGEAPAEPKQGPTGSSLPPQLPGGRGSRRAETRPNRILSPSPIAGRARLPPSRNKAQPDPFTLPN